MTISCVRHRGASRGFRSQFSLPHLLAPCLLMIFALRSSVPLYAQQEATVTDEQRILVIARQLRKQGAKSPAAAAGIAEQRLDDSTRIAVRSRSGRGELHERADDVFFVIAGKATLVLGGYLVNPVGTGEVRGDAVADGRQVSLHRGDVVHIPHSVPHQLMVSPGETFVYVVVKIPR